MGSNGPRQQDAWAEPPRRCPQTESPSHSKVKGERNRWKKGNKGQRSRQGSRPGRKGLQNCTRLSSCWCRTFLKSMHSFFTTCIFHEHFLRECIYLKAKQQRGRETASVFWFTPQMLQSGQSQKPGSPQVTGPSSAAFPDVLVGSSWDPTGTPTRGTSVASGSQT